MHKIIFYIQSTSDITNKYNADDNLITSEFHSDSEIIQSLETKAEGEAGADEQEPSTSTEQEVKAPTTQ